MRSRRSSSCSPPAASRTRRPAARGCRGSRPPTATSIVSSPSCARPMDWRWTDSLGVALRGRDLPGRTTDLARAAERAGLGSLWIIEDYFDPGAYALAAAAAAVTQRIVIRLGVVNPYTRHPALVAMDTAALAAFAPCLVCLRMCSCIPKMSDEQFATTFE